MRVPVHSVGRRGSRGAVGVGGVLRSPFPVGAGSRTHRCGVAVVGCDLGLCFGDRRWLCFDDVCGASSGVVVVVDGFDFALEFTHCVLAVVVRLSGRVYCGDGNSEKKEAWS